MQSQINGLQSQVSTLSATITNVQTEERRGIAAAAAMGITMTPSAPGKTTVTVNGGFFQGESAVGIAVAHAATSLDCRPSRAILPASVSNSCVRFSPGSAGWQS
jgi:autotransporter adhesin